MPCALLAGDLDHGMAAAWQRLEQPVALVWGRQARVSPVRHADSFVQITPRAHLTIFERCGVLPHDEHAAAFIHLVRAHLV